MAKLSSQRLKRLIHQVQGTGQVYKEALAVIAKDASEEARKKGSKTILDSHLFQVVQDSNQLSFLQGIEMKNKRNIGIRTISIASKKAKRLSSSSSCTEKKTTLPKQDQIKCEDSLTPIEYKLEDLKEEEENDSGEEFDFDS